MNFNSIKKKLSFIVQQIIKNYRPQKIILFGSLAQNKFTSDSDIDLLIIKSTRRRFIERISDVLLSCEYDIPIEPLVYTPQEIKERLALGDFFIKDVLERGIVLYGE